MRSSTSRKASWRARQAAQELLHQAQRSRLPVSHGWTDYFLARIVYQWNDLDLAARRFGELVDKRYRVHAHAARNGLIGLVHVYGVTGKVDEAWRIWQVLRQFDLDLTGHKTDETRAQRAWLLADARGFDQRPSLGERVHGEGAGPALDLAAASAHHQDPRLAGRGGRKLTCKARWR